MISHVAKSGLRVAAAGTHPFSSWVTQEITPLERYIGVKADMAELAQSLLIFGTHVHIGIEDPEFRIDARDGATVFRDLDGAPLGPAYDPRDIHTSWTVTVKAHQD